MSANPVAVGVVGCGNISGIYLETARKFEILRVAACSDLAPERAAAQAAKYGVPRACSVEELLADPGIEIVLNLTTPPSHGPIGLAAIRAGKSVYNEKPLAVGRAEARQMLDAARARKLRVGAAPDTFLGGGLQTCRKLVDDGAIGAPVGATAFMLCHGHESWHPAPDFYYQTGGGPLFDMGPYYLTALISLLGPVRCVTGSARITFPERTITSQPLCGTRIKVNTPTHIAGVLDFACGAIATLVTSFDVWSTETPLLEVYGTEGTLSVPDPNSFGGPVRLRRAGSDAWVEMPLTHACTENSRGVGVADMACALRSGRPHRASGEMAYHVLDIMHAIHDAARDGCRVDLASACPQPAPLPVGLPEYLMEHDREMA